MKNKFVNKIIILILLTILVSVYIMYIYYYYEKIDSISIIKHTVGSLNILGSYLSFLINKILSDSELLKTMILSLSAIYIFKNINLNRLINSITNFELGNLKISKGELEELKEGEENATSNTKDSSNDENVKYRSDIMQVMIDNEKIIDIIEKFISKPNSKMDIPLNLIPRLYKLETIAKIFDYTLKSNSLRILSIKKEIEPTLIDVYNELKEKCIIYSS
ncbi:hypothetical protein JY742_18040 [Clostridioides difficile]|nr:hypothetical protein [Clostridioides difficile]